MFQPRDGSNGHAGLGQTMTYFDQWPKKGAPYFGFKSRRHGRKHRGTSTRPASEWKWERGRMSQHRNGLQQTRHPVDMPSCVPHIFLMLISPVASLTCVTTPWSRDRMEIRNGGHLLDATASFGAQKRALAPVGAVGVMR